MALFPVGTAERSKARGSEEDNLLRLVVTVSDPVSVPVPIKLEGH